MRVVDTSAWIEWHLDTATAQKLVQYLPSRNEWIVPTMVQLELAKWAHREVAAQQADAIIAFATNCITVPLDTEIALLAAELSTQYRLATADAIIYASALNQHADLLTCDAHFEGLPGVLYVPKQQSQGAAEVLEGTVYDRVLKIG